MRTRPVPRDLGTCTARVACRSTRGGLFSCFRPPLPLFSPVWTSQNPNLPNISCTEKKLHNGLESGGMSYAPPPTPVTPSTALAGMSEGLGRTSVTPNFLLVARPAMSPRSPLYIPRPPMTPGSMIAAMPAKRFSFSPADTRLRSHAENPHVHVSKDPPGGNMARTTSIQIPATSLPLLRANGERMETEWTRSFGNRSDRQRKERAQRELEAPQEEPASTDHVDSLHDGSQSHRERGRFLPFPPAPAPFARTEHGTSTVFFCSHRHTRSSWNSRTPPNSHRS